MKRRSPDVKWLLSQKIDNTTSGSEVRGFLATFVERRKENGLFETPLTRAEFEAIARKISTGKNFTNAKIAALKRLKTLGLKVESGRGNCGRVNKCRHPSKTIRSPKPEKSTEPKVSAKEVRERALRVLHENDPTYCKVKHATIYIHNEHKSE